MANHIARFSFLENRNIFALEFGSHTLTITNKYEGLVVEGVKILGLNTAFFPAQSIKIFPASGATTLQTNYLTVLFNTGQAFPGFYEDYLVFKTNNGEAIVEMYAEVLPDVTSAIIDVYRYYNGNDYLFTSNPQAEINRLYQNKYTKEGIAFRLFQPGTPGTAITDGTTTGAFTSTNLNYALQGAWADGGDATTILLTAKQKALLDGFTSVATRMVDVSRTQQASITGAANIYVSDFGVHKVILNRYGRDSVVLCLDPSMWAIRFLREFKSRPLARTGDAEKRQIIAEWALVCRNPLASSKVVACA